MSYIFHCPVCNQDKPHYAKRMCERCYIKQYVPIKWSRKFDGCVKCGTDKLPHAGHGLCRHCFIVKDGEGQPCKCGCGQITAVLKGKPSDFIHGHWLKTDKALAQMHQYSVINSHGDKNPGFGKFGKDHPAFGHFTTEKCRKERSERMLKRLSQHLTDPTDIEIILSKILDDLDIIHKSQFIIDNKFAVDEFVPSCNLIIEAYGDYWHANPNKWKNDNMYPIQLRNSKKDYSRSRYFEAHGFSLLILWETDLKKNPDSCIASIKDLIVPLL